MSCFYLNLEEVLDLDPVGLAQELIQNVNWNVESVTSYIFL